MVTSGRKGSRVGLEVTDRVGLCSYSPFFKLMVAKTRPWVLFFLMPSFFHHNGRISHCLKKRFESMTALKQQIELLVIYGTLKNIDWDASL